MTTSLDRIAWPLSSSGAGCLAEEAGPDMGQAIAVNPYRGVNAAALSEDFQDGMVFGDVTVIDPFERDHESLRS